VALALAHVQKTPVPPSARSEFNIPAALDALILACLAKDPGARPASADILSERLSASIPPDAWTAKDARVWWEHHQPARPRAADVRDLASGAMTGDGGRDRRLNPAPANS
jgi:hypothetical protein